MKRQDIHLLEITKFDKKGNVPYVQRNSESLSCNYFCSRKAENITYPECVFVAFDTQHAMHVSHIVIRGLPGSTIFLPNFLINGTISENTIKQEICLLIFSIIFV
jgi:hypothetical protein